MSPSYLSREMKVMQTHRVQCSRKLPAVKAKELWTVDSPIDDQWSALRSALTEAAKSVLGTEKHKQPDWFLDSAELLEPLLQKRSQIYSRWLRTGLDRDDIISSLMHTGLPDKQ